MRDIFGQGVYSHVLRSTKPFISLGSINWYRLRPGVEVLRAATHKDDGRLAGQPVGESDEETCQRSPFGLALFVVPTCSPPHCKAAWKRPCQHTPLYKKAS
jgi:hypothetical protein